MALPIPEEIGLLNPLLPFWYVVLVLAIGKAVGAMIIYPIGGRAGDLLEAWTARWPYLRRLWPPTRRIVARYGYVGLFTLLAIPFMTDTLPVYVFAMLNAPANGPPAPAGPTSRPAVLARRLRLTPFVSVCFVAGLARGFLFLAIPVWLGWP